MLVGGMLIGVHKADRHSLDFPNPQSLHDVQHLSLVEGQNHFTVPGHAFPDFEAISARHERRRGIPLSVVELLAVGAPDLQGVAEAFGG